MSIFNLFQRTEDCPDECPTGSGGAAQSSERFPIIGSTSVINPDGTTFSTQIDINGVTATFSLVGESISAQSLSGFSWIDPPTGTPVLLPQNGGEYNGLVTVSFSDPVPLGSIELVSSVFGDQGVDCRANTFVPSYVSVDGATASGDVVLPSEASATTEVGFDGSLVSSLSFNAVAGSSDDYDTYYLASVGIVSITLSGGSEEECDQPFAYDPEAGSEIVEPDCTDWKEGLLCNSTFVLQKISWLFNKVSSAFLTIETRVDNLETGTGTSIDDINNNNVALEARVLALEGAPPYLVDVEIVNDEIIETYSDATNQVNSLASYIDIDTDTVVRSAVVVNDPDTDGNPDVELTLEDIDGNALGTVNFEIPIPAPTAANQVTGMTFDNATKILTLTQTTGGDQTVFIDI